jgi:hypothetical protein
MSKWMMVMIGLILLVGMVAAGVWFKRMGIRKQEIVLVQRYEAQNNVVETAAFKMRSTVKNQHECTDEWAKKFVEVVAAQARGRPGNLATGPSIPAAAGLLAVGGTGYKEADMLGIPQDLYLKLANSIEGQVGNFVRQQEILTDIWREHATYCQDPVINEFWMVDLLSKVRPKPEMITSAVVKDAVATKKMDEKMF